MNGAHWNRFKIKHSSRAVKWKKNWLISLCVFAFTGSRLIPKFTPFFMFAHFFYSHDSGNYGTSFRVVQTLFVHYVNFITHLSKKTVRKCIRHVKMMVTIWNGAKRYFNAWWTRTIMKSPYLSEILITEACWVSTRLDSIQLNSKECRENLGAKSNTVLRLIQYRE